MTVPEHKPFLVEIDGHDVLATEDNARGVMFRHEDDSQDYLEIELEDHKHWIFNNRELLIWMGSIFVKKGDDKLLRLANRNHGTFQEHCGWNLFCEVHDHATDFERETYTQSIIRNDDREHLTVDDILRRAEG